MTTFIGSSIWEFVLLNLVRADMRYAKKIGSLYEPLLPCISCWIPVCTSPFELQHNEPCPSGRAYIAIPERCQDCCHAHLSQDAHEDVMVCSRCGSVNGPAMGTRTGTTYAQSCGPSFAQHIRQTTPRVFTPSAYKRMNHFRNTLMRLQAKETLSIDADHIEKIVGELKKSNPLLNHHLVTYQVVKRAMKATGLQRYYNHVFWIIHHITGKRLVDLSKTQSKRLVDMFIAIQDAFARHRHHRVNMLSYIYLIKKFAEVLGWMRLSKCLPLLKSRDKVRQQDIIWRQICRTMGYQFTPSIM